MPKNEWLSAVRQAVNGNVTNDQGTGKCPVCHSKKFRFRVGNDGRLKFVCHSGRCAPRSKGEDRDPAWLVEVTEAMAGLGLPRTVLPRQGGKSANQRRPTHQHVRQRPQRASPPTQADVDTWGGHVRQGDRLQALADGRGISVQVLEDAEVGWDAGRREHRTRRYCFPVRHVRTGELLEADHYGLTAKPPRMVHQSGGTTHFYSPGGVDKSEPVFVCEGHIDALVARSHGLNAVAVTGGAESLPPEEEFAAFAGADVVIAFDCDSPGRRGAKKLGDAFALHGAATVRVLDLTRGGLAYSAKSGEDVSDWFEAHGKTAAQLRALADDTSRLADTAAEHTDVLWLSDVDQRPLSWLWSGRVPHGKLTILDGDPGLGKSTIWCDIVARVTTGEPFPGEDHNRESQKAMIVAAEDDLSDTIVPRLRAAGADIKSVATIPLSRGDDGNLIPLALPDDLDRIKAMLVRHEVKLLVIDPIMAFLSEAINSHNDASVRRALTPLAEVLQETGAACILIRHLNKSGEAAAIYRGGGSIAFTGAARSGLLVAPHPEDDEVRVLAQVKTNLSRKVPSLTYRVEKRSDDENVADTYIAWGDEVDTDADGLLGKKDGRRDTSVRDAAIAWLRDFLADGPQESTIVRQEGDLAGHSWITLKRAKAALSADSIRRRSEDGKTSSWLWSTGPAIEVEGPMKTKNGGK